MGRIGVNKQTRRFVMQLKSKWTMYDDARGDRHHCFMLGNIKLMEVVDSGRENGLLTMHFNFRKFVFSDEGGESVWRFKAERKLMNLLSEMYTDFLPTLETEYDYRVGVQERKEERANNAKRRRAGLDRDSVEVPPESDFLNILESIIKGRKW